MTYQTIKLKSKILNSFKFLEQAISYEMERQSAELDQQQTPAQELAVGTPPRMRRLFSARKNLPKTYRYFPDPDIPPIHLTETDLERIKADLPELPEARITRWQEEYAVEPRFGELLVTQLEYRDLWDQLFTELLSAQLKPNDVASMLVNKKLTMSTNVSQVIESYKSLTATASIDESELSSIINQVISEHPAETAAYRGGKEVLINFFVGQTMRKLGKKVDIVQVKGRLQKELLV